MIENVFIELSLIIILATIISVVMRTLKQPLIIGYILTGILAGPYVFNIVESTELVVSFSQLGIVFLLFIAGLSLNPMVMKRVGKVSLITGIGQVLFTTAVGFGIAKLFGFSDIVALYVAVALTFSSTIIIVKLLSDKGDLQTLYGRISLGFLIVQDIVAIIILMLISPSAGGLSSLMGINILSVWAGVLAGLVLFSIYVLPRIVKFYANSNELLTLFSIGWLLLLSVIFWYLNSVEIGALLAGISLSVSPYHHEIRMRMNVLRDFFIMFFFVLLGSQMVFMNTAGFLLPIAVFSAFILVGNPLIVMVLMGGLNYTKRNSFLAGLTVAQISEFSLILIALGVRLGQLSTEILSMVTAIGLVTIFGSTYMIMYANRLYTRVSQYLGIFERKGKKIDEHIYHRRTKYDVILFGYNRLGYSLLEQVKKMKKRFLVIDFDPEIIIKLAREGNECRYGDANDAELLNDLDFSHTKMVMSTIPDVDTNMLIMDKVKKKNKKAIIIVVAHQIEDALKLYRNGAAYVVMPYFLGGQFASNLIHRNGMNLHKFLKEKAHHMKHLKTRAMLSHEHPKAEKHR